MDDARTPNSGEENYPAREVGWYNAIAYCNRLSAVHGLEAVYYTNSSFSTVFSPSGTVPNSGFIYAKWDAVGYRLPTEAEWEYAARGGRDDNADTDFSGSRDISRVAWYGENTGKTNPESVKPKWPTN